MIALRSFHLSLVLLLGACGASPTGEGGGGGGGGGGDGGGGKSDDPDPCADGACENHCPDGTRTTLQGRVLAPNGVDPIPFAQVYVATSVPPIEPGVACELCSEVGGGGLVRTTTAVDGTFTLGPIPTAAEQAAGVEVQLVVQKGRFRRVSEVAIDAPCEANDAPPAATTLPGKAGGQDTIPAIAVATGDFDVMECVLLDLGLEPGSFDLYNGLDPLLDTGGGTEGGLDDLLGDLALMKQYNVIFLNCAANTYEDKLADAAIRGNIEAYVAGGGRLYVTDWSYDYIEQIPEFSPMIDFAPGASGAPPEPRDAAAVGADAVEIEAAVLDDELASWLEAVEEVTGDEIISDDRRVHLEHFVSSWVMQFAALPEIAKVWLEGDAGAGQVSGSRPLTTTFDYQECGRVLYSSYHTSGREGFDEDGFPGYCSAGASSPQERVLLFLVLHVADCIDDVVE